jgi:hypothetical protein
MGNFVCDNSPVPGSTSGTGGTGGSSGTGSAGTTCTAPSGAPVPNGVVIIRSEGVASDNRTRVVLEVTLAPGQGTNKATNTPLAALCASCANGCDDNSSVQNGIVVNSPIKENPLPMVALVVALAVVQAARWAQAASSPRQRERPAEA